MTQTIHTHNLGYPRIGAKRELKFATEAFWKGKSDLSTLEECGRTLRAKHWATQAEAGIDLIPSNDFSFYDQILDHSLLIGNIPERFQQHNNANPTPDLPLLFAMARGQSDEHHSCCQTSSNTFACEMTKWFDTNYHYIVPEFHSNTEFKLVGQKIFQEFEEAKALGYQTKPVLPGPATYLSLGKVQDEKNPNFNRWELLDSLVTVYEEILQKLATLGAEWVQIDEPIFSLDLDESQKSALIYSWSRLAKAAPKLKLIVANYFGSLDDNLSLFFNLPAQAYHLDTTRGNDTIEEVLKKIPQEKILSLGIIDGRNVWKNDYTESLNFLKIAQKSLGPDRLWIAPSCSLLHSPVTLQNEDQLDPELKQWMAFADEKLHEISDLKSLLLGTARAFLITNNIQAHADRASSTRIHNTYVQERIHCIRPDHSQRISAYPARRKAQQERLKLPDFPTTTIGSFPQATNVRRQRARWKKGTISTAEYEAFLEEETRQCITWQDENGLDLLVHGEFERNDMVEYFGEQLEGFLFTAYGWVQSYGTRCVKPPVIYGDVNRPNPMTVRWAKFAQSCSDRPVKGMLTGPVTILQWSFVRDDQARQITAQQIALAIRDEAIDLEAAGIAAIQIDEPALREGLPLRRGDWEAYLTWATEAFRLSASGVRNDTQIHTHMCYAEFNDIIAAIAALDADVITIETSRSQMELLEAFVDFNYPNEIGPGIYDIHSPRISSIEEMSQLIAKAEAVIPHHQLWINPDCGLKTRAWPEVREALQNMVAVAQQYRKNVNRSLTH